MLNTLFTFIEILYLYKKTTIMGQFVDYLSSMIPSFDNEKGQKEVTNHNNKESASNQSPSSKNHVTFVDNSFSFGRHEGEKAAKLAAISFSNQRTVNIYQSIGALAFLSHLIWAVYPQFSAEEFDYTDLNNYRQLSLSCFTPLVVYWAAFGAMNQVKKPLSEGAKLSSKNAGLDLNCNPFIMSTKIIVLLTALCQVGSIYFDQLNWLLLLIIPVWCYKLTSKIAQSEYERYTVTPKKPIFRGLNIIKSPKSSKSPSKDAARSNQSTPVKKPVQSTEYFQGQPTPRTRTRRAVKNLITGVSDKYHAFEQNVAQQFSQKLFTPMSPKSTKMITDK